MTMKLILVLLFASVAVMGRAAEPKLENLVRQFDYDRNAPLNVREEKKEQREGATIIELSYDSPRGGRIPATLVLPRGRGPFAAILFGHWMMPRSEFRNRKEFLAEALLLARAGAASLLTDAPMVRPGFIPERDGLKGQIQNAEASRQPVIDFRRGVDLLLARGDIDTARIAFVGHSYNAHTGGILAGVEKRIGSFVLVAGVFADEEYIFDSTRTEVIQFRQKNGEKALRDFFQQYAFDDPVHFIGHSAPAAMFLQFGQEDEGIPEKLARGYFARFAEPKQIAFYKAGHALNAEAREERVEWLVERLKLSKIDRDAIKRVPGLEKSEKEEKE
jgi:cephalosporin-C deacetylase-like acetyl esterase